jgi:hypothetical protein
MKIMADMSMYDMEQRIKALENRLGMLEGEIRNKMGKSLMDMHTMYQDQSEALDQLTLLVGKLIQTVFPKTPDNELV